MIWPFKRAYRANFQPLALPPRRTTSHEAPYNTDTGSRYNFNETCFQIEVISTAKVVTGVNRAGRPKVVYAAR